MASDHDHDDRRQELAATLEALNVAKRQVVASAIVFGMEQSARPRRIDAMTLAEVELVRCIATQRPNWVESTRVNLADPFAAELLEILMRAQERLHRIAFQSLGAIGEPPP
ncbi:hypothetical protein [Cyanobium sp. LEGE 06113]|uniref:hypothetical protein n=1 Tax=Cyanobium sp. LEGE 06113 TaxID=1297573 RepID=UPI0018814B36|nr:hypothetical protein [Cyanobium sp. LEGE 06113]MBE9155178.1 hypothetical protein [Cyanobium sp. LEGE 06113]